MTAGVKPLITAFRVYPVHLLKRRGGASLGCIVPATSFASTQAYLLPLLYILKKESDICPLYFIHGQ